MEKFLECALARNRSLLLINLFDLKVEFTEFETLPSFPDTLVCADHSQRQLIIATKDSSLLLAYDSQRLWASALAWKYSIQIMEEFPWSRWLDAHKHLQVEFFSFLPQADNHGGLSCLIEKPLTNEGEGLSI